MMIFFHFSKVRHFFSLKEAILDPKCKTKKLDYALNLRLYDVPVRRNSIFRAEGHCWILCPLQPYFSPFTFLGLCVPQDRKIVYVSLRALKFAYTSTNSSKFGGKPLH